MGWKIAWVAVKGKPFDTVVAELALARTGEFEALPEAEFSGLKVPSGWIVVVNCFSAGEFLLAQDLTAVKRNAEIVTCCLNETTMTSPVTSFRDGPELWSVEHACNIAADHLAVSGTPPEAFIAIRDALPPPEADETVDFVFDVPVDLGAAITGYRHNQDVGLGEAPYELLEPRRIMQRLRRWLR